MGGGVSVDEQQKRWFEAIFKLLDRDANGTLDKEELKSFIFAFKTIEDAEAEAAAKKSVKAMIRKVDGKADADGDGKADSAKDGKIDPVSNVKSIYLL